MMMRYLLVFFTACACLMFGPTLQAQNYVCTLYQSGDRYIATPTDELMKGTLAIFEDDNCLSQTSAVETGSDAWAYANSRAGAEALCRSGAAPLRDHPDASRASVNRRLWRCVARRQAGSSPASVRKLPPPRPTGQTLMQVSLLRLHAFDGIGSGINFQRLREAGIGLQNVIDLGWLDAVDVWGEVGAGYRVCFPQIGRLIFLDAANAPRIPEAVPFAIDDGYTCATLSRAGTLVLVTDPQAAADDSDAITLADCTVTAARNLYLRDRPEGTVQTKQIPGGLALPTWSRTSSWFAVLYDGHFGWVAERFVTAEGDCQYRALAQA